MRNSRVYHSAVLWALIVVLYVIVEGAPQNNDDLNNNCKCPSAHQVCNAFTHKCVSCEDVCSEDNTNYDASTCNSSCAAATESVDGMNLFVRKDSDGEDFPVLYHLQEEVSMLRIISSVSLAIAAASILSLLLFLIYIWRKRLLCFEDNHRKEKAYALGLFPPTTGNSDSTLPAQLPRGMPCPQMNRDDQTPMKASPAPSSVSARLGTNRAFRREPSESTTPEFAYDNPALAPSPSHSQGMREDPLPILERRTQTEL